MKKNSLDLNLLYEQIKTSSTELNEAVTAIAEDVLLNPTSYGLPPSQEDLRSELSIRILQNGVTGIKKYKPSLCSFKTYVCTFVKFQIKNILRDSKKLCCMENHISSMSKICQEETSDNYDKDEFSFKITHISKYHPAETDKVPFRKNKLYFNEQNFKTSQENLTIKDYFLGAKSKVARTTIILALNSAFYLDVNHIENMALFCQIPFNVFQDAVSEAAKDLEKRHKKLEQLKNHRDKSFQLHMKFQQQLSENLSEEKRKETFAKYIFQTINWQNKNSLLQKEGYRVCPTNKKIGEMVGICERQVGYYLQNAEKIFSLHNEELKKVMDL